MKQMKKLMGLLLALILIFSMTVTAFAADGEMEGTLEGGKITVGDAELDETYKLYQILYLDSFDDTGMVEGSDGNPKGGNYSYKANSEWAAFIKDVTLDDGKKAFNVDENDAVTWAYDSEERRFAEQVANKALAYAKEHDIKPVASYDPATAGESTTKVEFSDLKLGYYLLDSTLGSLCSLDTTNKEITIQDKNEKPTNVKQVWEDGNDKWGNINNPDQPFNDDDIGSEIKFRSEITVRKGTENLLFHDTMSEGLTFDPSSVKLSYKAEGATGYSPVDSSHYEVIEKTQTTGNEVINAETEKCSFHVNFLEGFYTALHSGKAASYTIMVEYSAVLNESAVIGDAGNPNESLVSYGEKNTTTTASKTLTKTWEFPVFKYTGEGTERKPLNNTKFTLARNADNVPIQFVQIKSGVEAGKEDVEALYRVATAEEIANAKSDDNPGGVEIFTTITTNNSGRFRLSGLDSATYNLTETEAKSGYNKLKNAISVVIGIDGTIQQNNGKVNTIEIHNGTGSELPSTGGIGTTIFYVAGSALLLSAVVLLVTKKRMSAEK